MIADNDNELPRTRAEAKAIGSHWYFTGKPCPKGHLAKRDVKYCQCATCNLENANAWKDANPDRTTERQREWYLDNRELTISRAKEYAQKNIDTVRETKRRWREVDPERAKRTQKKADRNHRSTPQGKLDTNIRSGFRRGLRRGSKNGRRTFDLLEYTADELRSHLEKQFLPGMSWENYGKWHVDHKIPLSAHNYETPDDIDFKKAWSLSNLQPLWATDNIRKHAKLTSSFQPSLALAA